MFKEIEKWFANLCTVHQVDPIKDILLPNITLDKLAAIIALIVAIRTFKASNRIAKLNFECQLAASHRDIWSKTITNNNNLSEITNLNADLAAITNDQRRFVIFIIINTKLAYLSKKLKVVEFSLQPKKDTGVFFNLPIPNEIWQNVKEFYSKDFEKYIEEAKIYAIDPSLTNLRKRVIRKAISSFNIFKAELGSLLNRQNKKIYIDRTLYNNLKAIGGNLNTHTTIALEEYLLKFS